MELRDWMALLGGLALFLYGMHQMSAALEAAAGDKLKQILEKLTANRFLGVIAGAFVTSVIQSSSATTVLAVGFVNAGIMDLRRAVWIIMGANIGTTITGQLMAMDVGALAPFVAFVGVVLAVFLKDPSWNGTGDILAGLGILFIGMEMMGGAMLPLHESRQFLLWMEHFSNPLPGILGGALFTALIQSSSAAVGILQALAQSGAVPFSGAVYILFGQNIGTCMTAILASFGTCQNAKRATLVHLYFNMIGTVLFTILCMATPLVMLVEHTAPNDPAAQVANMHTLFNVATTLLLFPFGNQLADLAERSYQ